MWMALAPGEAFTHTHIEQSITTLREGTVDLEVAGSRTGLVPNSPTSIDPNATHTLINVGTIVAIIECGHLQGDPPRAGEVEP